jgi:hypothetical protein
MIKNMTGLFELVEEQLRTEDNKHSNDQTSNGFDYLLQSHKGGHPLIIAYNEMKTS